MSTKFHKAGTAAKNMMKIPRSNPVIDNQGNSSSKVKLLSYRHTQNSNQANAKTKRKSTSKEDAVDLFIEGANLPCQDEISTRVALKFLNSFPDVENAITCYRSYEETRRREKLYIIWINEPDLYNELMSKTFLVIVSYI
ncbi:hypothetical protein GJ496_001573 [Pomphorhynchus laevis]|nr:hypothetical protein GJ496_001573 [Pomphorhynchus laevis]